GRSRPPLETNRKLERSDRRAVGVAAQAMRAVPPGRLDVRARFAAELATFALDIGFLTSASAVLARHGGLLDVVRSKGRASLRGLFFPACFLLLSSWKWLIASLRRRSVPQRSGGRAPAE